MTSIQPSAHLWGRSLAAALLVSGLALGCGPAEVAGDAEQGTLMLVANGEEFVRDGFTTKDGWDIRFDQVLVTLADVEAHQTDPPFDPASNEGLQATETVVLLAEPMTVDLTATAGDEEVVMVSESAAPVGHFNAVSWNVVLAEDGEAAGAAIALFGQATKDGRTVDFTLRLEQPLSYTCGEFVGDERKGIVTAAAAADTEVTFHFDHIFGDADLPEGDELNVGALGFEPLAALAAGDTLNADLATLEAELSPEDYATLADAIANLGHVGEGHCR